MSGTAAAPDPRPDFHWNNELPVFHLAFPWNTGSLVGQLHCRWRQHGEPDQWLGEQLVGGLVTTWARGGQAVSSFCRVLPSSAELSRHQRLRPSTTLMMTDSTEPWPENPSISAATSSWNVAVLTSFGAPARQGTSHSILIHSSGLSSNW